MKMSVTHYFITQSVSYFRIAFQVRSCAHKQSTETTGIFNCLGMMNVNYCFLQRTLISQRRDAGKML